MNKLYRLFALASCFAWLLAACGGEGDGGSPADDVWQPTEVGAACDDGDPCTENDRVQEDGTCAGVAIVCDDGVSCTEDRCEAGACVHELKAGYCLDGESCAASGTVHPEDACRECVALGGRDQWQLRENGSECEPGDACREASVCLAGECVAGKTTECEGEGECLVGACDPETGCVLVPREGSCDDGDPCTVGDRCVEGACVGGEEALDCQTEDLCVVGRCEPGEGCVFEPKCDDGDPCTEDSCDPMTGACTNTPFVGPCDDGDLCTVGKMCNEEGECVGGEARVCDDDNPCTDDYCDEARGCVFRFKDEVCDEEGCEAAPCDDGSQCTQDDRCVAGACVGVKTGLCNLCILEPSGKAAKITKLHISEDGMSGAGIDVDGSEDTCQPTYDCEEGIDNVMAALAFLINPSMQDALNDGVVKWVIDMGNFRFEGEPFQLAVYDSVLGTWGCDFQGETCGYYVNQLSFDASCGPSFAFHDARIEGGRLFAGGRDTMIHLMMPMGAGRSLTLTIAWARIDGVIAFNEDGTIQKIGGAIGGAIPKQQLLGAIRSLDPEAFAFPGLTPEGAANLVDQAVQPDIDLDGDGVNESLSVGIQIDSIGAEILGSN